MSQTIELLCVWLKSPDQKCAIHPESTPHQSGSPAREPVEPALLPATAPSLAGELRAKCARPRLPSGDPSPAPVAATLSAWRLIVPEGFTLNTDSCYRTLANPAVHWR